MRDELEPIVVGAGLAAQMRYIMDHLHPFDGMRLILRILRFYMLGGRGGGAVLAFPTLDDILNAPGLASFNPVIPTWICVDQQGPPGERLGLVRGPPREPHRPDFYI